MSKNEEIQSDASIKEQVISNPQQRAKLELRKEELDITKRVVKVGEVKIHKEVVTEKKTIIVPVSREELVIEKTALNPSSSDQTNTSTETIRIPICEERIEVVKHPTVLENVSVYKRQFSENELIEKTLKKEQLHIETIGNPRVINKAAENLSSLNEQT